MLKSMKLNLITATLVTGLGVAPVAFADHNSVWGEGWASMPNDIHNTRMDTMDDDPEVFQEFIAEGAGADSVNRFLDDDTDSFESSMGGGMGGASDDVASASSDRGSRQ